MNVTLLPDYQPSDDEEFMNPRMVEFFRQKLLTWRTELVEASNTTLHDLQQGGIGEAAIAARTSGETKRSLQLTTRHRARN
mgnify:CR=1 FL=1